MQVPSDDYQPGEGAPIRQLTWNDSDHFRVMTQLYGSVWPKVLPFCLFNVGLTLVIYTLKKHADTDITTSPTGHRYMSLLMSFLIVTRSKITYDNYMEASLHLANSYRACRETVQTACILTRDDLSKGAQQWRHDVAHAAIVLLRVTVAILDFKSTPTSPPWDCPELSLAEQKEIKQYSLLRQLQQRQQHPQLSQSEELIDSLSPDHMAHSTVEGRLPLEESFRAPNVLAYNVRSEILKQRDGTWLTKPLATIEEIALLDKVAEFMQAFSGLKKCMTTPLPFPLLQMAKTFLFVWLFTLPFVLCRDHYHRPWVLLIVVFLITFGFLGLEFVAMELSDTFGDDPSDFDDLGNAQLCFEDCYIAIYKVDGEKWAQKLRSRMDPRSRSRYGGADERSSSFDIGDASQSRRVPDVLDETETAHDDSIANMADLVLPPEFMVVPSAEPRRKGWPSWFHRRRR